MSHEDFGTVNVSRSERAREIEVMRQHFRRHREALVNMAADAPTEHLATEYRRLIHELDVSLHKLDDLERSAGDVPLAPMPNAGYEPGDLPPAEGVARSRLAIIIGVAVVALALIGWLIWRASSGSPDRGAIVETTAPTATEATAPPVIVESIVVTPPTQDYGVIRKGTRATRRFEIANRTDEPVSIALARSSCRCLYYEHSEVVAPNGKEEVTVTVDGARAKAGELRETVKVTSKSSPAVETSFDVIATIR